LQPMSEDEDNENGHQIVITVPQIAHFTAGFLTALSALIRQVLVVIGFVGFELYENLQYLRSEDWAIHETLEFMAGFFSGVVVLLFASTL